uniref:Uncharacterized protein n=1 Tax=Mesocestoides corti TaxID=53468 RepID=A0A5K3EUP5_MESCO
MKNAGITDQALLTNHKPEPLVRRLPSKFTTLATPLFIYCTSSMSFSGWLLTFLACHWNAEGHRIGCSQVVQHVCALIRRHTPLHHRNPFFCGMPQQEMAYSTNRYLVYAANALSSKLFLKGFQCFNSFLFNSYYPIFCKMI